MKPQEKATLRGRRKRRTKKIKRTRRRKKTRGDQDPTPIRKKKKKKRPLDNPRNPARIKKAVSESKNLASIRQETTMSSPPSPNEENPVGPRAKISKSKI